MKSLYFLLLILICFFSCQKERSSEVEKTSAPLVDVYVAGYVSGDANSPDEYPTYWKNGSPVPLDFDYSLKTARALSIAVSGTDVYVAGYRINFSPTRITTVGIFWKNGIPEEVTNFQDDPKEVTSLVVSNNDVYMVGPTYEIPKYFKNGIPVNLTDGPIYSAFSSMAVSGTDVYVAGTQYDGILVQNGIVSYHNGIAKYWKNRNIINLTDGSKDATATSIAVSGTDVYVAGYEDGLAKYWKNGVPMNLTDGLTGGEANSIAVSGTDVFVAGTQWDGFDTVNTYGYRYRNPIAKYWKNGNPVKLTNGRTDAAAESIAVSGDDVYVAGYENGVAKYWKNGSPVILGDVSKYSEAYSIFLAKR